MLPILNDYLDRLQALHADIRRAITGLPQAALDWSPGPEMNSLAVLAAHIAGSERYWIGDVAGGEPSGRDRAAEFQTKAADADSLLARLDAALAHSQTVLERLTLPELEEPRRMPPGSARGERVVTGAWALAHALEHVAIHVGHTQIVRQLWDQAHADK
ncbi:MAG TPA: DinB family protein [Anaerolineae bacterium]|nr:DinB family protein [Anaerolineae bacterium]